ncbi:MAG: cysteine desulfurase [Candidatus Omnitrophica bacterium]|nr:cysteine desulfurase [Candidatus Omnitrophota bacterium]
MSSIKKPIYFDNNATTPLHPQVKAEITKALDIFGNPSSLHQFGRKANEAIEHSRKTIATFIGANPEEIIFVGSGSEANNTALSIFCCQSGKCSFQSKNQSSLITTRIEHPCILETSRCLKGKGTNMFYLDVDEYGKINPNQLKDLTTNKIGLVSVMMANNEIGTIQDIKEIAKIAHNSGMLAHTDAVQAVGKIPVNVGELDVDFLTMSAHKIYGPKGIGALYVKKGTPFCPLIHGGHQEQGRRAGTESTLGIIAFGKAIEMRAKEMTEEETRLSQLKNILKSAIEEKIPDIKFNGHPTDCLTGTLNVSFTGAEGEAILLYLDLEGICVSTGSACASGSLDPSHVLLAVGLSAEQAHGSIRISIGRENTIEDINYLIEKLPKVIKKVRNMSTAY